MKLQLGMKSDFKQHTTHVKVEWKGQTLSKQAKCIICAGVNFCSILFLFFFFLLLGCKSSGSSRARVLQEFTTGRNFRPTKYNNTAPAAQKYVYYSIKWAEEGRVHNYTRCVPQVLFASAYSEGHTTTTTTTMYNIVLLSPRRRGASTLFAQLMRKRRRRWLFYICVHIFHNFLHFSPAYMCWLCCSRRARKGRWTNLVRDNSPLPPVRSRAHIEPHCSLCNELIAGCEFTNKNCLFTIFTVFYSN